MSNPKPLTMGTPLTQSVATFRAAQKAHARATASLERADRAAEKAKKAMESAKSGLDKAKREMQAAFLQDVDPMPLVPAQRSESGILTVSMDMGAAFAKLARNFG